MHTHWRWICRPNICLVSGDDDDSGGCNGENTRWIRDGLVLVGHPNYGLNRNLLEPDSMYRFLVFPGLKNPNSKFPLAETWVVSLSKTVSFGAKESTAMENLKKKRKMNSKEATWNGVSYFILSTHSWKNKKTPILWEKYYFQTSKLMNK